MYKAKLAFRQGTEVLFKQYLQLQSDHGWMVVTPRVMSVKWMQILADPGIRL